MNFGLEENIIEKITRILEEQPKVDKAYIFGSRAKGNYRPDSDIDIALKGYDLTVEDVLKMSGAIDKLKIGYEVDLVDYESIKEKALRDHVDRVGMEFYSRWKQHKLGDLLNIKHGFAFDGKNIVIEPTNNILVTPGNFHIGGGFKQDKFKYYKGSIPEGYILHEGDIVVTMTDLSQETDTLGYSAKIPKKNGAIFLHNQRIGLLEFISSDNTDQDYIYWLMRSFDYQRYILNSASGTSIMHTSPTRIRNYSFLLPPLEEQRSIAIILSGLEEKIDLLHRQNKTLESIAESIFRQWFVEEAEESWEERELNDIAQHVKEALTPSSQPNDIYYHYSLPAFDSGRNPTVETGKDILSNKYRVIKNSILVSKLNPRFPRIWGIFGDSIVPNSICSTEFQVLRPTNIIYWSFIYYYLKSPLATNELSGAAGGTSGSHQRVSPTDIMQLKFLLPSPDKIEKFDTLVKSQFEKIKRNMDEIQVLIQLRDSLLPKLLSGEARVKMS